MDINDLRSAITLLSFAAFIGIVAWAWARSNRERFDEAAQLPLVDETGQEDTRHE
ncbi:MAG: cbb3-type cytochrome c oxidase subunit 3 [Burkholderiaceae bacterium]|nr:cbb3-type cytochrome c oxidase subunit 3 [Burkholderiaceae bacterium]MDH3459941.1 cbb3-type cytochrome c oxidase subunit 3 [Burkholderiaceae bacterium]